MKPTHPPGRQGKGRQTKGRQAVGRSFEQAEPCYVYLAVHKAGQRFKIGLSNDPLRRFADLPEADDIDLETTLARRMPSRARASEVERSLHRALAPFRLRIAQQGDGYTEWFLLDAFARAVAIVDAMPDLEAPAHSLRSDAKGRRADPMAIVAEHNVARAMAVVAMWRQARRLVGLTVAAERGAVRLVVKNFKATPVNAGAGMRASLFDIDGMYALRSARQTRVPPSLVRLLTYDGPKSSDLRIELQDWAALRRLPGGDRVVQLMRDGIELIRIESRLGVARRAQLSAEVVGAGVARLLEPRQDDAPATPSLWE